MSAPKTRFKVRVRITSLVDHEVEAESEDLAEEIAHEDFRRRLLCAAHCFEEDMNIRAVERLP